MITMCKNFKKLLKEKNNMNINDIIEYVAEEYSVEKANVEAIVKCAFKKIVKEVSAGNKVSLREFGTFEVRKHKARVARNPKTGESVDVPEKFVPTFEACKTFREYANNKMRLNG